MAMKSFYDMLEQMVFVTGPTLKPEEATVIALGAIAEAINDLAHEIAHMGVEGRPIHMVDLSS